MINKLVIIYPALVLISLCSFSTYKILSQRQLLISPNVNFVNKVKKMATPTATISAIPKTTTTPGQLIAVINNYRTNIGINPYSIEPKLCSIIDTMTTSSQKPQEIMYSQCPECTQSAVINISNQDTPDNLHQQLINDNNSMLILDNDSFTSVCASQTGSIITLLFAGYDKPAQPQITTTQATPTPITIKNFTEDELWQALSEYRKDHKKPELNKHEKLCEYARERVEEHIKNYHELDISQYPNQEKYPLDAHAGFKRDAESGHLFELTQMSKVAENLAYYPTAQYATHIIEWGWDSSTEGHRETQLSEEYTQGCVSGREGFYVAIFGKN